MEKLKSTLPNMLIVLTGICVIAGAILAAVNNMTAGPIAEAQALALEQAIKDVTRGLYGGYSGRGFLEGLSG